MQQPPPADLADFPRYPLDAGRCWYRAHEVRPDEDDLGCWYFASRPVGREPGGRFDLGVPEGTCYLGATEGVVARERVGRFLAHHIPIPPERFEDAVVSRVTLPQGVRVLADIASTESAKFQVTAELGSGHGNYGVCVQWAQALRSAGFDGIHYAPRFTPGGGETALAVFDRQGARPEYGTVDRRPLVDVLDDLGYSRARSTLPTSQQASVDDDAEPEPAG